MKKEKSAGGVAMMGAGDMRAPESPGAGAAPGASPGIDRRADIAQPPAPGTVTIRCVDYGPERLQTETVEDLDRLLEQPRPDWSRVRWINVDGLNPYTINRLREHFGFHTLAAEDALTVPQRAKLEPYEDHLFIVAHMLTASNGKLSDEQVSFVFFADTLITFQERSGDVWEPVRKRFQDEKSRLRRHAVDYLLYALLDSIVDHFFPILEDFGDRLEQVEDSIMGCPAPEELQRLYGVKRDLVLLRRVMWPMRQMTDELYRSEVDSIDDACRNYLRDVYDHTVQVIDMIETYREMASGLTDLYMSSISNRMNEIMKVLTIMASLFIPVTFLAGVYGMNFQHIPELAWKGAYPTFWVACIAILVGLVVFFRRRGWIGRS